MSAPNPQNSRKTTEVAVGVLICPDGRVLLADRPQGKPYAGYWEFPGGKIEPGETVAAALARELHEELGIDIAPPTPWVTTEYDYPHAYVRLHFYRVTSWQGVPRGQEGQRLDFFDPTGALPQPLLPAALAPLKWLTLPATYAISNAAVLGKAEFLRRSEAAIQQGLRLIQLREPTLDDATLSQLIEALTPRAQVLVSSRHARELWIKAQGMHLTARDLMSITSRAQLPEACRWVGASVHTRAELEHAARIGCDFAVVGPVQNTASHPQAMPLGWAGFAALIQHAPLPVYALGGLRAADLPQAESVGAHGVDLLSAAWPPKHSSSTH